MKSFKNGSKDFLRNKVCFNYLLVIYVYLTICTDFVLLQMRFHLHFQPKPFWNTCRGYCYRDDKPGNSNTWTKSDI